MSHFFYSPFRYRNSIIQSLLVTCLIGPVLFSFPCFALVLLSGNQNADNVNRAHPLPRRPFRVWYQPPWIIDEPDLYKHVNLHVSAKEKATETLNSRGICALRWSWGPQSNYSDNDPEYFYNYVNPLRKGGEDYTWAGFAIDEWNHGNSSLKAREAAAKGYRKAKRRFPNLFLAAWVTGPDPLFIELVRDGTFDLAMIEGYHWWAGKPGQGIGYGGVVQRLKKMKRAGVVNRTIAGWGHVAAKPSSQGGMDKKQLRKRVVDTASKFPAMPGVCFMGTGKFDNEKTRQLISYANELAYKTYPDYPAIANQKTLNIPGELFTVVGDEKSSIPETTDFLTLRPSGPESLQLTFDLSAFSHIEQDIISAKLVLFANAVQNDDRRVLQVLPDTGDNTRHPLDSRIWYNSGELQFDVSTPIRQYQSDGKSGLYTVTISDIPTGWNPPAKESWSIELKRMAEWKNAFAHLEITY